MSDSVANRYMHRKVVGDSVVNYDSINTMNNIVYILSHNICTCTPDKHHNES